VKRSKRMQTVEKVVADTERKRAAALGASERRLSESESRLAELQTYQKTYAQQFNARAGAGIGAGGLRDYQTFMARLAEAVKQQKQIVLKARADRDAELQVWRHAAQRAQAVGGLVKRWQHEERRADDRREQSESDERSQRPSLQSLQVRGS
jgi:flagellar protein FliJ